jgi:hypothetical protein
MSISNTCGHLEGMNESVFHHVVSFIGPRLFVWGILLSGLHLPAEDKPFVMPDDRARELAYFGDIPELRLLCGSEKTLEALEKSSHASPHAILNAAIMGEAWEVISLLVEYGWPEKYPPSESLSYSLPLRAIPELVNRVPDFNARLGNDLMRYSLFRGNIPLAQALHSTGVPLGHAQDALVAATGRRNMTAIDWLLDQGIDPALPKNRSSLTVARQLKSADLLAKLDRSGRHAEEISALRKQYGPASDDAANIAGVWAHRKDGFGSIVFVFYPDGTGTLSGDIGSFPILWSADALHIKVADLTPVTVGQPGSFELYRQKDSLVLKTGKSNELTRLVRENDAYAPRTLPQPRHRPERIRLQTAVLDSSGELWIGLNGRHMHVPLAQLIAAAAKTNYGFDPVPGNILDWENFSAGHVPEAVLKQAYEMPLDPRSADPRFAPQWKELYITHGQPAVLSGDSDYTLFRGQTTLPIHLDPSPKANPEYLLTFALLSRQPLSHGKRWVLIFLRRGRADKSGP